MGDVRQTAKAIVAVIHLESSGIRVGDLGVSGTRNAEHDRGYVKTHWKREVREGRNRTPSGDAWLTVEVELAAWTRMR